MSAPNSVGVPIQVIGVGLSGLDSLDAFAMQLVQQATLVIGAQRHLDTLDTLNMTAEVWRLSDFSSMLEALRSHLETDPKARAVVLTTGDPLFFGLGRLLLGAFDPNQLVFHPSVSSMQLAFSRLKVPWQDATLVSVHGRGEDQLVRAVKKGAAKIAVLTDGVMTPGAIATLIQSLDLPIRYQLWVCENLGSAQEQIRLHPPDKRPEPDYAALNVVVLLKENMPLETAHLKPPRLDATSVENPAKASEISTLPLIGLPDTVFNSFPDRPLLMTKREIRLLALGAIAPLENQIIWDIGAGTGAVSVELSRLCPSAQIYAIEKTAIGVSLIRQNAERLAIAPIYAIKGKAPAVLATLPTPDRVFIGGSSGQLMDILNCIHQKLSASDQNDVKCHKRVVLAIATIEHLTNVMTWLSQPSPAQTWQCQLTQINISRSLPVGPLTRFSPLNPVTLVTLQIRQ